MTSSLVGSEMCIRDSLQTHHVVESRTQYSSSSTSKSGNKTQWVSMTTSVSYTHLTLPTICSV
eukprot:1302711-Prorocentrum_lima.AAC.1